MSDLLLMRGSPLRQLLSTSGLVACYLPYLQVAQGLTGQTLIDYSPQGNHAQIGSTAGADTNDPSWGTNALTFGGDDYCVIGRPSALEASVPFCGYTVFSKGADGTDMALCSKYGNHGLGSGANRTGWVVSSRDDNKMAFYTWDSSGNIKLINSTGTALSSGGYYGVFWGWDGTNLQIQLGDVAEIPVVGGFAANTSDSSFLGRGGGGIYYTGNIAMNLIVTGRCWTAPEISHNRQIIKTLLAGRGVSFA